MGIIVCGLRLFVRPDDHLILFNAFAGKKYDDSPKEIYLHMLQDERFKDYKLVWAFHNPSQYEVPKKIKTDNLNYFMMALSARVWITNSSFERGLSFKGKNTFYLNTWHGTPIKLMGSDISVDNESFGVDHRNQRKRKVSSVDAFCSQGRYETEIFSRTFNIPKERILEFGLPRNDILAHYTEGQRDAIRRSLGIEDWQRVILYCPTFREYEKDESLGVVMAPPVDLKKWERKLTNKYVLLIRAHYEVYEVMHIEENDFVRNMTNYRSINELFIASDILISDYSSVFFDYSITGKPMLHFCYDYNKYASKRGMYFDIREWIDGADDEDVLISKICNLDLKHSEEKTTSFRDKYINFYGNAAKQTVDFLADVLK